LLLQNQREMSPTRKITHFIPTFHDPSADSLRMDAKTLYDSDIATHTHRHPLNGPLSGTTRISRYQRGKSNLDFTEARHSEWQWHQLGHMQVCISLQTDNHSSTAPLSFYRPDALHAAQPQHLSTEGKKHGTFHKSACHL